MGDVSTFSDLLSMPVKCILTTHDMTSNIIMYIRLGYNSHFSGYQKWLYHIVITKQYMLRVGRVAQEVVPAEQASGTEFKPQHH